MPPTSFGRYSYDCDLYARVGVRVAFANQSQIKSARSLEVVLSNYRTFSGLFRTRMSRFQSRTDTTGCRRWVHRRLRCGRRRLLARVPFVRRVAAVDADVVRRLAVAQPPLVVDTAVDLKKHGEWVSDQNTLKHTEKYMKRSYV